MTMDTLVYPAPADCGAAQALLVLLPGANMSASDFASHGFVRAVRRRAWPIDILAVDTGVECYLDDDVAERLHHEVIAPTLARGAAKLWLAGISMGGFGALRYAQDHGDLVEGLLLLAPFIGSRGLIAKVEAAGGICRWAGANGAPATPQQHLLEWLAARDRGYRGRPEIHLGFGAGDRFARAHRLLAALLPAARVTTMTGGHDWATWEALWERLLDSAACGAYVEPEVPA